MAARFVLCTLPCVLLAFDDHALLQQTLRRDPIIDEMSAIFGGLAGGNDSKNEEEGPPAPPEHDEAQDRVCTKEEQDKFEAAMAEYRVKAAKVRRLQSAEDGSRFQLQFKKMQEDLTRVAEPFFRAQQEGADFLVAAVKTAVQDVVKFVLMDVAHPAEPYDKPSTNVLRESSIKFLEQLKQSGEPFGVHLVVGGIKTLSAYIEDTAAKQFPEVHNLLPAPSSAASPSQARELPPFMLSFLKDRVAPMVVAQINPGMAKLVHLIGRIPTNESGWLPFLTNELMPELPKTCQDLVSIWSMIIGKLDSSGDPLSLFGPLFDMSSVGIDCGTTLSQSDQIRHSDEEPRKIFEMPEPPTRNCVTCQDKASSEALNPLSFKSCLVPCGNTIYTCAVRSLNDACLKKTAKCVGCYRGMVMDIAECEESDARKPLLDKLEQLDEVLANGSVEKDGVASLAEALTSLIFNKPIGQ